MDSSTVRAVSSSAASASSPPEISSTSESQPRGRRTSIFRHSQGRAASDQARFTSVRFARVFREIGSDQLEGGYDEGDPVGIPASRRHRGSNDETRLGMEATKTYAQMG